MVDKEIVILFGLIVGVSVLGGTLYNIGTTQFDTPVVEQGNVTKLYIIPGRDSGSSLGVSPSSGGTVIIFTPGSSDNFYMVLNREKEYSISHDEFIKINEGDEVRVTHYSPMDRQIEVIRRGES